MTIPILPLCIFVKEKETQLVTVIVDVYNFLCNIMIDSAGSYDIFVVYVDSSGTLISAAQAGSNKRSSSAILLL